MARRFICNVHQGLVGAKELHEVKLARATLPGEDQGAGDIAMDRVVVGEVCDECWELLSALVSDVNLDGVEDFRDKALGRLRLDAKADEIEREDEQEAQLRVAS